MSTSEYVRNLRKALNMSQAAFGKELGVQAAAVCNWESGSRKVPDSAIIKMVHTFGASLDYLKTGEGEMFASASASSSESTANLPSPFEYAQAQGCNETISRLFARYCALPKDGKEAFEKIVDALLVEKTVAPIPTGSRIVVNNATSERGDAVINQTFGN